MMDIPEFKSIVQFPQGKKLYLCMCSILKRSPIMVGDINVLTLGISIWNFDFDFDFWI